MLFCMYVCIVHVHVGTHDIQNISVSSPHPGQVMVTGDFIQGSTAIGLLVAVNNESYTQYHRGILDVIIKGLSAGRYTVSIFSILINGYPSERAATGQRIIEVIGGGNHLYFIECTKLFMLTLVLLETYILLLCIHTCMYINNIHYIDTSLVLNEAFIHYELHSNYTGVCVRCTFPTKSTAKDCLAVVQLSSSSLTTIQSSHKFNKSGNSAYGCIEGVNLTDYYIGVINGILIQKNSFEDQTSKFTQIQCTCMYYCRSGNFSLLNNFHC